MMLLPKVDMSIFETLLARRSVRQYKAREVGQDVVHSLLEAAVHAPTAVHQEPWGFVVIQDKKQLKHLSDTAKPLFVSAIELRTLHTGHEMENFGQDEFNIFYNAGTLILICGTADAPFVEADCWLAAENLILAACAMGLGSCVIGSALLALNMADIKHALGVPSGYSVVAPIIIGYPDDKISPVTRKRPLIFKSPSLATHT
ncbi:MAG: nitroreductase family protein [Methylophilaceae bacterium]